MANPLFNMYGNSMLCGMERIIAPFIPQIIQQARAFKQQFSGDPRQEVQRLLDSGEMSQEQFNQLSQQTQQILRFMGGR